MKVLGFFTRFNIHIVDGAGEWTAPQRKQARCQISTLLLTKALGKGIIFSNLIRISLYPLISLLYYKCRLFRINRNNVRRSLQILITQPRD